jgi:hypothetical protein
MAADETRGSSDQDPAFAPVSDHDQEARNESHASRGS